MSFDADGFEVDDDIQVNDNDDTYVAWNWKMGGAGGTSHTQGNRDTTVSANQDAGQSVMYWTGAGSGPYTLGHGLSKAPDVWVYKNVHDTGFYYMYHTSLSDPFAKILYPNDTDGEVSSVNVTATSSTLITVPDGGATDSPNRLIAYAFHSVDGYSKFGKYIGNNNADGTFIYLGFRPKWFMLKAITTSDGWLIYDSARDTVNDGDTDLALYANNDPAESEYGNLDLLSNGVKIRVAASAMNESHTYIYLAFAETPFKYSNAR